MLEKPGNAARSHLCCVLSADTLKSLLQQLDSNQAAKENAVQEQNDKLSEKDRLIQSNKAEIERLEKRTKMYEHKVQDRKQPSQSLGDGCDLIFFFHQTKSWFSFFF